MTILLAAAAAAAALLFLVAVTPLVDARRQRILRRCLLDVSDVLNAAGIDYWCDFGTLLGQYREGDIIRTDYDVDLCVMADEKPKVVALSGALGARGYSLTDQGGREKRLVRIADTRSAYHVDVYVYRPDGEMLRSTFRSVEDVPAALVADRIVVPFQGGVVRTPRDVERLLLFRYGPGFRTPRRGDQGTAYGYKRMEMFIRLLENNCVGLWSMLRSR